MQKRLWLSLFTSLTIGFCGGFTTFSAFSAEFVNLVEQGRALRAIVYVVASVTAGVSATLFGLFVGNRIISTRV